MCSEIGKHVDNQYNVVQLLLTTLSVARLHIAGYR